MRYVHLAALGTPPEGRLANRRREWEPVLGRSSRRSSPAPKPSSTLQEAGEIAQAAPSCLLCYEADWQVCHRRRVAEILCRRHGFAVRHLAVRAEMSCNRSSATQKWATFGSHLYHHHIS